MFRVTIRAIEANEDNQLPVTFSLGIPAYCLIVSVLPLQTIGWRLLKVGSRPLGWRAGRF